MTLTREQIEELGVGVFADNILDGVKVKDLCDLALQGLDAQAENQKLREALKMASHAIDNWVCLYAPDECGEGAVKAALVDVEAGVLVYTADVKREIRAALKQEPKL